ncbi:MAG TPA: hypothetical protein VF151_10760 [Gemmatimonadales bacterium]
MIRLTAMRHPEIEGDVPLYVDAYRIITIGRGETQFNKSTSIEAHRQAIESMWQEVQRIAEQLRQLVPTPDTEEQMRAFVEMRECIASLNAAHAMVARYANDPERWPRQVATVIELACGTALEHGVMLARVWVEDPPDEVARLRDEALVADALGLSMLWRQPGMPRV